MRTKENARKPVRKQTLRAFKIYGILVLTVAALVATSIIGPISRNGRVHAFNDFAQLAITSPAGGTFTLRDGVTNNPFTIDPGIVPGTLSLARYVPPASSFSSATSENGYRGAVQSCLSRYSLDGSHATPVKSTGSCNVVSVPDAALGDQTGLTGTAALDHQWIQGEDEQELIYQLPSTSTNCIVFPSIDHNAGIYEAIEFTVWGFRAGDTPSAFFPGNPSWIEGRLVRVFQDGWSAHNPADAYCNSFPFPNPSAPTQFDTDDFASVWSFRDASGGLVTVSHVAILAGMSVHITPEPPSNLTDDSTNCFAEQINGSVGSGFYTSHDCEIDAVGLSTGVTGCIGNECLPSAGCTFTQGYWKTHGPTGCATGNNTNQWPVSSLTLGTVNYSASQLCSIMNTAPKSNGLISLAHQLIAAKLNIANGSDPTAIASTIAAADALIGGKVVPPIGSGSLSPASVSALVNTLTSYNEGTIGPGHCN